MRSTDRHAHDSPGDPLAVQVTGLQHSYHDSDPLLLPDLRIAQGERHVVMGPSGSGKTTLLHAISGLLRPTQGTICVAGRDLSTFDAASLDRFRARELGIVFQQVHLMRSLTAIENLLLARYLAGLAQDSQRALALLADLGVADRARARPSALSRGEAQRVALARALINEPRILIADEPTSSLDDASCEAVLSLLVEQSSARELTLVVATHDARVRSRFDAITELTPCA